MHITEALLNQGLNPDLVGPTGAEFPENWIYQRVKEISHLITAPTIWFYNMLERIPLDCMIAGSYWNSLSSNKIAI